MGTWWEQTALRRAVIADKPDLFFAPAYTAPVGIGVPLAVTIHDISFVAHPEWFRPRERVRRRWLSGRAAASARVIFTDSEFSRDEIMTRLGAPRGRIRVIPPGVPSVAAASIPSGRQPLVLYVGTLFNRRRLPDLVAAFARATADLPDARLAIVGHDRTWPAQDLRAEAQAHGVSGKVALRSYVTDAELADLYARASAFAFLSEYEGFGLTPLEALAAGVPVVMLDTPVAREVCGDAATYVNRGDINGTAVALRALLTNPRTAAERLTHAAAVLGRYSWDRAAAETLAELERVARDAR
jgi:glycosyltransferase involved in cell wall biosynthesis